MNHLGDALEKREAANDFYLHSKFFLLFQIYERAWTLAGKNNSPIIYLSYESAFYGSGIFSFCALEIVLKNFPIILFTNEIPAFTQHFF